MSFLNPKRPDPVPIPDPSDTANRAGGLKARRLAAGGRNATFLAQIAGDAAAARPAATLTGLNG